MRIRRSSTLLYTTILAFVFTLGTTEMTAQDQVAKTTSEVVEAPVSSEDATVAAPPTASPARSNLTRVGIASAQPISLSLDEAIRRSLANNNTIEITRDDVRFQETQIRSILGFYDPVFTITPTLTRNSTTGAGQATHDFTLNSSVTHFLRHGGGNYQAFFNNNRTENEFSQQRVTSGNLSSSNSSSAVFFSQVGFRYTQPLFRNLGIDVNRRNLKIARRVLEQTDADFRRQTIEIIAQVQRTYWDLVFALRDQQNRQANLELSRENLRLVEARIRAGSSAPLARWEVETELANRESELLLATQLVSITDNSLKQLVLRDATSAEWSSSYVPTDKPAFSLDSVNLDAAIKDAMDNRYELRRLKLATDINKIDIAFFKNQTKPQIDLNTTVSLDGLSLGGASTDSVLVPQFSGNDEILRQRLNLLLAPGLQIPNPNVEIPGTPSFLVGGFGRSLANTFRSDAPNYSVGVTISFPFRNRTAKAELAGARVLENQIATQMRAQEQVVIVEVRNAVQALETARQRVLAARRARQNAEELLKGERALFDAGRSTTFLLFERENSLTNARNAEIRAETDYNKAIADLQRATSTTFQMNNIDVVSPTEDK